MLWLDVPAAAPAQHRRGTGIPSARHRHHKLHAVECLAARLARRVEPRPPQRAPRRRPRPPPPLLAAGHPLGGAGGPRIGREWEREKNE